jgi:hypothetical protein
MTTPSTLFIAEENESLCFAALDRQWLDLIDHRCSSSTAIEMQLENHVEQLLSEPVGDTEVDVEWTLYNAERNVGLDE